MTARIHPGVGYVARFESEHRLVLILKYVDELSTKKIASMLDRSLAGHEVAVEQSTSSVGRQTEGEPS